MNEALKPTSDVKFSCPRCGSSHFGSSGKSDGTATHYHCHGDDRGSRCTWSCPSSEFWKHCVLVTTQRFSTAAEYWAAYHATR